MTEIRKEVFYGAIATALLLAMYVGLLYVFNGPGHTLEQVYSYWPLISLLLLGFGVQVGLFFYARTELGKLAKTKQLAATGGVSAGSMVLCCLHHVTDVIPILGLSGIFLFAAEATPFFLVLGILSNVVGIITLLSVLASHGVLPKPLPTEAPWREFKQVSIVLAIGILFLFGALLWLVPTTSAIAPGGTSFPQLTDVKNKVTVDAVLSLVDTSTAIKLTFTTHEGDMAFRVEDIATLTDDQGTTYGKGVWSGSPPGGHHRSGTLTFTAPAPTAKKLFLTLKDTATPRVFTWAIK